MFHLEYKILLCDQKMAFTKLREEKYGGPYLQTQQTILETQHNIFETQHKIIETQHDIIQTQH